METTATNSAVVIKGCTIAAVMASYRAAKPYWVAAFPSCQVVASFLATTCPSFLAASYRVAAFPSCPAVASCPVIASSRTFLAAVTCRTFLAAAATCPSFLAATFPSFLATSFMAATSPSFLAASWAVRSPCHPAAALPYFTHLHLTPARFGYLQGRQ